jgi:hypothetical protein
MINNSKNIVTFRRAILAIVLVGAATAYYFSDISIDKILNYEDDLQVNQTNMELTVYGGPWALDGHNTFYILKHKDSDQNFLFVTRSNAVAITPVEMKVAIQPSTEE